MENKTDHDILIRVESKVESLTDEVRLMRDGTKEDISKLYNQKVEVTVFNEFKNDVINQNRENDSRFQKNERLIYIGFGIVITLEFVIGLLAMFYK